jgi:hypothetical protein
VGHVPTFFIIGMEIIYMEGLNRDEERFFARNYTTLG